MRDHIQTEDTQLRVAVIDIGSNSVRLVVLDGPGRAPDYFYNEKVICGLGEGVSQTGLLNPKGRKRALNTLIRFAAIIEDLAVDRVYAIATAAVRDAEDGADLVAEIAQHTGIQVRVASGAEEGMLAGLGVLMGMPNAEGLVVDIGGASMEMAQIGEGSVGRSVTSPLGPLALQDVSEKKRTAYIGLHVAKLREAHPAKAPVLYLVGGSWRALAQIDMNRNAWPLKVLQDYQPEPEALQHTAHWVRKKSVEDLREFATSSDSRLQLLPGAAAVLEEIFKQFAPRRVHISALGLREGAVFENLSPEIRAIDPLISACRSIEARSARQSGFGDAVYLWIKEALPGLKPRESRILQAACLLHDTHWTTHPDFRASIAVEAAARANLIGIDHQGRAMLGLALTHRYKGRERAEEEVDKLRSILDEKRATLAEAMGRLIRLAAAFSGGSENILQRAKLKRINASLVLQIEKSQSALIGDVVERRLARAARAQGLTPYIDFV